MIRVLREQHQASAAVERRLRLAGGINRFGEPNYHAVWGWSRLGWVGGLWEDRNAAGELLRSVAELRFVPKYEPLDRWHIERWVPPEAYGPPREWYLQSTELAGGMRIPALGPYPSRGEYEHCFTLEDAQGRFVQLTPRVAEHIAMAIEFSRNLRSGVRRAAIERRIEREERAYDSYVDSLL